MAPQLANYVNHMEEVCGHLLATLSQDAVASPHLCPPRLLLPLLQLLSSHVATRAKAVQCDSRFLTTLMSHALMMKLMFLTPPASLHEGQRHAALTAAAPLVAALLLPRCAAISGATFASLRGDCALQPVVGAILSSITAVCNKLPPRLSLFVLSSCHMSTLVLRAVDEAGSLPQGLAGDHASHRAILILAVYTRIVASLIQCLSKEGCEGAPPGSPELRDLLAGPLLQLLGSPLLSLLAHTPHVLVWVEAAGLTRCQYQLHYLMPFQLPDVEDNGPIPQVGSLPLFSCNLSVICTIGLYRRQLPRVLFFQFICY